MKFVYIFLILLGGMSVLQGLQTSSLKVSPQPPNDQELLDLMKTRCTKCHAWKPIQSVSVERWEKVYPRMARKAKLSEDESKRVWMYIRKNLK